jgi:quercetin dioxygenase-like cupin family protein
MDVPPCNPLFDLWFDTLVLSMTKNGSSEFVLNFKGRSMFNRPFSLPLTAKWSDLYDHISPSEKDAYMEIIKNSEVTMEVVAKGRTRYLAHLSNLMMVVIDFQDGPASQPDPPHSHPHEQISYVVSGEINVVLGNETTRLGPGDIFTVPPNMPHSIQLLAPTARLVDAFTPIREEFLK